MKELLSLVLPALIVWLVMTLGMRRRCRRCRRVQEIERLLNSSGKAA